MGIDWIDDILQKAEGWPLVGGAVHQLRFAYEIWRETPADPGPVQAQGQNLGDLTTTASGLRDALNESLLALRQSWGGDEATAYLGPDVTAFQIEHDMEPAATGTGYQLWQNLAGIADLLNYNGGAHTTVGQHLQKIQDLHGTLDFQVKLGAGTLLGMAATIEIPVVDVATDGGGAIALGAEAADAAGTGEAVVAIEQTVVAAEAVQTATTVAPWVIALLATGGIATIVGVSFLAWHFLSNSGSTTPPPQKYYPPGIDTDAKKARYDALFLLYGDPILVAMMVNAGMDDAQCQAAYLLYIQFVTGSQCDAFRQAIAIMIQNGMTSAQIAAALSGIALFSINRKLPANALFPQLTGATLSWGSVSPGFGLQHILDGHDTDFQCWQINDPQNNAADQNLLVKLLQAAVNAIFTGLANNSPNVVAIPGFAPNLAFRINSFKPGGFGPGGCPLVIVIDPTQGNNIVTAFKPRV